MSTVARMVPTGMPTGAGATVHFDVRTSCVSGRKSIPPAQEVSSQRTRRRRK
jgi:hypothetical protein